jgi:hypothetical protein
LNFKLEAQGIRTMTKCPRCNLEQENSPQCEYCGLVFETFSDSTPAAKALKPKRIGLFAIVLVVTGVLVAGYLLISYHHKSGEKSASIEHSSDLGILKDLTGGYTKGSIIAMIIFSIIGLGYFTYGKKSQQLIMLICGIALMGYSYFVDGTGYIILIGAGLSVLPFIFGKK